MGDTVRADLSLREISYRIPDCGLCFAENHETSKTNLHPRVYCSLAGFLSIGNWVGGNSGSTVNQASPFKSPQQREAERSAKRQAVLLAAVRMFNERGFHATSLDDVATSLGISKRTIYHYLSSKDQVLLECVTIGLSQLLAAAEQARSQPGTARERLIAFLRRYAEINMEDFGRCVIRSGEEDLSDESLPRYRELKREIDAAMRRMFEDAIADGSIPDLDVMLASFTVAGALNWPARWYRPGGPRSREEIAAGMVDILMRGLGNSAT